MSCKLILPKRVSSLARLGRLLKGKQFEDAKFYIICDENTYNHCLPLLIASVSALEDAEFFEVPVGEEAKTIDVATQLWGALCDANADRNSVIVNLGGGCISDLGGFVAASYRRGIRYVNIPTTLIGMVDAAIGGKTAVNMGVVKNQVGFFHQPAAVCIYPGFLSTLEERELHSGFFEMVKTALLIPHSMLFEQLRDGFSTPECLATTTFESSLSQCADFKNAVTLQDPMEKSIRKILNFGHTFGHGIESYYMAMGKPVAHGIAVGIGLICELYLSVKKLGMSDKILNDYVGLFKTVGRIPSFDLKAAEAILSYMRYDKKNVDGLILCVLLMDVGSVAINVALTENEVRDALLTLRHL